MKKRFTCLLLAALLFLCGGCHNTSEGEKDSAGKEGAGAQEPFDAQTAGEVWQDNTLDLYTGKFNRSLKPVQSEADGEIRIIDYALEDSQAAIFVRQIIPGENRDSLNIVTRGGEKSSLNLKEYDLNSLYSAGKICGSGGYVLVAWEPGSPYCLQIVDEELKVTGSFDIDEKLLNEEDGISHVMMDSVGNIHLISASGSAWRYLVLDSQGELIAEVTESSYDIPKIVALKDGNIAICSRIEEEGTGSHLWKVDSASGIREILANTPAHMESWDVLYFTLWDENTLLYADLEGLYRSDLSGRNPELLYEWLRHGIQPQSIEDLQVGEDQSISLLYEDVDGMNYLYLEPAVEQREIHEITMAVPSYQMGKYKAYAARFTKMYPAYSIRLEEMEYNDTRLLTELNAGKGPVLIDTSLIGFAQHEELWEPLDQVLEQEGLEGELILKVLEQGRIDETLYGIVDDWYIQTVITAAVDRDDWDYDEFLEEIAARPELLSICNVWDGVSFINIFFFQSLTGNYLIDAEKGITHFDSDIFRSILHYGRDLTLENSSIHDFSEMVKALKEGHMLCYEAHFVRVQELADWRKELGDSMKFIGYPGENGSQHYIVSSGPIAVRAAASEEDKQIAMLFLKSILTYDSQNVAALDTDFHMSVRWDVFEEQLLDTWDTNYKDSGSGGTETDKEQNREDYMALLEQAVPDSYLPRELLDIIMEELENYFSGAITEEQVIDHLKNRVELYLMEQK